MDFSVLVAVKFFVCSFLLLASASASESTVLRIFCWNIHHGVGVDGKLDLQRIANVIRAAKPDLVALQEVDNQCARSGKTDQTAELARLTGMSGLFGKAMDYDGGGYGQAILSRHAISSHQVHHLPGKGEPRIAFEVATTIEGTEIRVISLHLDLDPVHRLAQAKVVATLNASTRHPLILCGDFNDTPTSATFETFKEPWTPVPKAAPHLTHPADKPDGEIDHFFIRGFKPHAPAQVLPEAVASDHRPMIADFTLAD